MADSSATADANAGATSGAIGVGGDYAEEGGTINKDTIYEDSENKRSLPGGGPGGPVPNMIAPFHDGRPTANLQDVRTILSVRKTYTIAQLAVLESAADMDLTVRAYQSYMKALGHPAKGLKGLDPAGEITIVVAFPTRDGKLTMPEYKTDIAHITAKADDGDCDVVALMAATAIEAYRHGSTKLILTGQGARKLLESSGWAIMLGAMTSAINDNDGTALGGGGATGIGYGSVQSSYAFEPFFQGYGVK